VKHIYEIYPYLICLEHQKKKRKPWILLPQVLAMMTSVFFFLSNYENLLNRNFRSKNNHQCIQMVVLLIAIVNNRYENSFIF
jgi:hypothetical protein